MATSVNSRNESTGGTLGPRKTMIIMVTVVGCIAILWPKVFYPMMVGPGQTKSVIKDHRGPGIRQERPPHLRPETIHPAMRERGRAIPQTGSVHSERPSSPPRIVEGRPGPIPGMRPPMGAGSHQPTKSANSMGFIMPLYTIGIVSFFIYTILKLVFKKTPTAPYPEIKPDATFRNEVFTTDQTYIKRPDSGNTKLVVTAIQGLICAADEQLIKIDNIKKSANNLSKETEETDNQEAAEKVPEPSIETLDSTVESDTTEDEQQDRLPDTDEEAPTKIEKPKKREPSEERGTLKVIPMEKKAKYEPGRQSSRPGTPVQSVTLDSALVEVDASEAKCILLDSKTPQTSKVVVTDPDLSIETLDATHKHDEEAPFDLNLIVVFESVSNLNQGRSLELNVLLGSEPTTVVHASSAANRVASPTKEVVLSGKMKLSLVKLDDNDKSSSNAVVTEVKDSTDKKDDSTRDPLRPNETN